MESVLIKCEYCSETNSVLKSNLSKDLYCQHCKAHLKIIHTPIKMTIQNFREQVLYMPGFVMAMFFSPKDKHCHELSPIVDFVARADAGIIRVVKVNVLEEESLAASYQVNEVPTIILFSHGKFVKKYIGNMTKGQLESWILSAT